MSEISEVLEDDLGEKVLGVAISIHFNDIFLPNDKISHMRAQNKIDSLLSDKSDEELISANNYILGIKEQHQKDKLNDNVCMCNIALRYLSKYLPKETENSTAASADENCAEF